MKDLSRWVAAMVFVSSAFACTPAPDAPSKPKPQAPEPAEPLPQTIQEVRELRTAGNTSLATRGLESLAMSPDPSTRRTALVMLALDATAEGRWDDTIESLEPAIELWPELAPFLRLRLAEAASKAGRHARAVEAANAVLIQHGTSSAAAVARAILPRLLLAAGDSAGAGAAVTELTRQPVDSFTEPEIVRTADALGNGGATALAATLRMHLLSRHPQGRAVEGVYAQLTATQDSPLLAMSPSAQLELAERLGRYNRYDQSLDLLQRIAARSPETAAGASYRFILANAYFNSRRYDQVATIAMKPDEPYYLAVELLRGRAAWRSDRNEEFLRSMQSLMRNHPKSAEAKSARLQLAKYYVTDASDPGLSIRLMREAVNEGSVGNDGENIWSLGWMQTLAGLEDDALATFASYLQKYPDADYTTNALFWTGKIHGRRGNLEARNDAFRRLIAQYPYSYYSYRARDISGLPIELDPQAPTFPDVSAAASDPRLAVVRTLFELGMTADAARELQTLTGGSATDPALAFQLADLYESAGEILKANAILQRQFRDFVRHAGRNIPDRFWRILYPMPHADAIRTSATRASVDPFLVAAITRQESGFEPTVVSNAGAVGLMQIMPEEASRIATAAGLPPLGRAELFDPATNIAVGASEIRQKIDIMGGDQLLGIAAYNAGEAAVGRWVAKTPRDDIDVFVESIPFNETRLYVKTVTRNLFEYRRIYGTP